LSTRLADGGCAKRIQNAWNGYDAMTSSWDTSVLVQNDYTCDYSGNRLTNTISDDTGPIRTEEYGYDALSRLTSVDYDDGQTQTYTFDPMGNRTQKADSVTGTENYTHNNANMLLTRGSNNYTNDLNGNTFTGGGRTNTWDAQDRLTQVVGGGNTTSYVYGYDGQRRRYTVGTTSTDYILDGTSVVRERQGSANVATYLIGTRGPEYGRNDSTGAVRWYLYDGLGSVLGEMDSSGNLTATRKYDAYGAVRGSTGTSTSSHKFVGNLGHRSEDDTGLMYMGARYYDPVAGRFASEDPAADGLNWFTYADNAPVNKVDPSGKAAVELALLVFVASILATAYGLVQGAVLKSLLKLGRVKFAQYLEGKVLDLLATSKAEQDTGAAIIRQGDAMGGDNPLAVLTKGIGSVVAFGGARKFSTALALFSVARFIRYMEF